MRKIVFMLISVPTLLITMIAGVSPTTDAGMSVEETTVYVVEESTVCTEPIVLFTEPTVPTTESTIPETTEATTEPPVTEPPATEPEEPELISLGTFKLTAYCSCQRCCGSYALNRPVDESGNEIVYGSIGVRLVAGVSIAVDPRVIPYGTQVEIDGHTYTAHDTGGNIKGNRIDVYFDDHQEAWDFGTQYAEVFVYGTED